MAYPNNISFKFEVNVGTGKFCVPKMSKDLMDEGTVKLMNASEKEDMFRKKFREMNNYCS